ncbi:MAG: response regulator [Myxococcota bacterium]
MAELQPRVLVVDDERFFREAILQALDEAGITCDAVASGDEALRAALDPEVGVVVLDVTLADVPGIEVLRRLRAERPGLRVIVLSGQTDQELVLEALRLDASDYLAKPLHNEELVLAVRRALGAFDAESSWQRLRDRVGRLEARLAELLDDRGTAGHGDSAAFAALAASAVSQVLDAGKTSVMAFDPADDRLRVIGACGSGLAPADMDPVALGEGVAGFALAQDEPVLVDDVYLDARFADRTLHERYESSSLVVLPLVSAEQRLGVLCATDRARAAPFGDDDVALLRVLALPVAAFLLGLQSGADELEPVPAALLGERSQDAEAPAVGAATQDTEAPAVGAATQDAEAPTAAQDAGEAVTAEAVLEHDTAELAREICEAMTVEVEPERLLASALAAVARHLDGEVVALHLIDNPRGELVLEQQVERDGVGDHRRLPRDRGLTGLVLQTGSLVATNHPERDPRFDASVDTAEDGEPRPMLCVPLRLRGKVLGLFRGFLDAGAGDAARTGEILGAALSAAVRNVLLYRSLLESIDEVADVRREGAFVIRR